MSGAFAFTLFICFLFLWYVMIKAIIPLYLFLADRFTEKRIPSMGRHLGLGEGEIFIHVILAAGCFLSDSSYGYSYITEYGDPWYTAWIMSRLAFCALFIRNPLTINFDGIDRLITNPLHASMASDILCIMMALSILPIAADAVYMGNDDYKIMIDRWICLIACVISLVTPSLHLTRYTVPAWNKNKVNVKQ